MPIPAHTALSVPTAASSEGVYRVRDPKGDVADFATGKRVMHACYKVFTRNCLVRGPHRVVVRCGWHK